MATFNEVYDIYRDVQPEMDLPAFSRYANELTGTNEFDAGQSGGFGGLVKKGSYWLDKALEYTGAPQAAGEIGAATWEAFGANSDYGRQVGESLPRMAAPMALFAAGPIGAAAGTAILAGQTYADTDSVPRAAIAALTPFAMGKAGHMVGEALLAKGAFNSVTNKLVASEAGVATQALISSARDKWLNYGASELAANAAGELINYTTEAIAQGTLNPYEGLTWKDKALELAIGNLPYNLKDLHALKPFSGEALPIGPAKFAQKDPDEPTPVLSTEGITQQSAIERALEIEAMEKKHSTLDLDPETAKTAQSAIDLEIQAKRDALSGTGFAGAKPLSTRSLTELLDTMGSMKVTDEGLLARQQELAQREQSLLGAKPVEPTDLDAGLRDTGEVSDADVFANVQNEVYRRVAETPPVDPVELATAPPERAAQVVEETSALTKLARPDPAAAKAQLELLRQAREARLRETKPEDMPQAIATDIAAQHNVAVHEAKQKTSLEQEYPYKAETTLDRKTDNTLGQNVVNPNATGPDKARFESTEEAQAFADNLNVGRKDPVSRYVVRQRQDSSGTARPVVALQFVDRESMGKYLASRRAEALKRANAPKEKEEVAKVLAAVTKKPTTYHDKVARDVLVQKFDAYAQRLLRDDYITDTEYQKAVKAVSEGVDPLEMGKSLKLLQERRIERDDSEGTFLAPAIGVDQPPTRPGLSDSVIPTNREVLENYFRRAGFPESGVKTWADFTEGIINDFNIPDLKLGELLNERADGSFFRGMADMKRNIVYMATFDAGKSPFSYARNIGATIAHELTHIVHQKALEGSLDFHPVGKATKRLYNNMRKEHDRQLATGKPSKYQDLMVEWLKTIAPAYKDLTAFRDMLANSTPQEQFANMGALWAAARFAKHEAKAFGMAMPPETRSWVREMSAFAKAMFAKIRGISWTEEGRILPSFRKGVDSFHEYFDTLVRAMDDSEFRLDQAQKMIDMGRDTVWADKRLWNLSTGNMIKQADGTMLLPKEYGFLTMQTDEPATQASRIPGKIANVNDEFIRTGGAMAAQVPVFKRAWSALFQHVADKTKLFNQAMSATVGGVTEAGNLRMKGPEAALFDAANRGKNGKLNKVASQIMQAMQRQPDQAFDIQDYLKGEDKVWSQGGVKINLSEKVRGLSDFEKKSLSHVIKSLAIGHQKMGEANIESINQTAKNFLAFELGNNLPPEKWSQAPEHVERLTSAIDKIASQDPTQRMLGAQELEAVKQQIGNDQLVNSLMQTWVSNRSDTEALRALYARSKGHMSNVRSGNFEVKAYNEKGEHISDLVKTREEALIWKADKKKAGFTSFVGPDPVPDRNKIRVDDDTLQFIQQVNDRAKARIDAMEIEPEMKALLTKDLDIAGNVARLMGAKDLSRTASMKGLSGGQRTLTPGSQDMVESQKLYFSIMAAHNATKVARSRIAYELTNPELKRFPDDLARFKRHHDNYFTPDSELTRKIMETNAVWHLGASLPAMITNTFQPMMTATSELINGGIGATKATLMTAKAINDMGKLSLHLMKKGLGIGKETSGFDLIKDPEERAMLKKMVMDGYMVHGASEITDPDADAGIDLNYFTKTGEKFKHWDKAKSVVNQLKNFSMKGFVASEQHNMRVSALLGWRMQKEIMGKNFDPKKAFENTVEFMRNTTYSGGRVNRPLVQGDHKALGAMAYSLQGYTLGWLGQLTRYLQHAKGADYLNLTPAQVKNARKAATHFLGVQLAAAGVMGMPFVGAFLKLLEKTTGEDVTGDLYTQLGQLLDQDEEEGGGLANTVMNGAANGLLANAGVPIDMGSRWSVNGVLGLNSYDGFDGDAVFGPTGGLVSSALAGIKSAAAGDLAGAVKGFSPTGIKKGLQYMLNDGEVKTSQGNLVQLDQAEKLAYIAGFNPQSLSNLQKLRSLERSRQDSDELDLQSFTSEVLTTLKENPDDARRLIQQRVEKSGGAETIQQLAKTVTRQAADAAFPVDPRTTMTKQNRSHMMELANMLGVRLPEAQQVAKREYQNELLKALRVSPIEVTRQLREQDRSWGAEMLQR